MKNKGYFEAPTQKQIDFVRAISDSLNICFPTCSKDFTKRNYMEFIKKYINEFYRLSPDMGEDELYLECDNDIWSEYY